MAIRRLSVMMQTVGRGAGAEQAVRNSSTANPATLVKTLPVFVESAVVEAVGAARYRLLVNGAPQSATPATDEPLKAGDAAWATRTLDGRYVLLGSDKG